MWLTERKTQAGALEETYAFVDIVAVLGSLAVTDFDADVSDLFVAPLPPGIPPIPQSFAGDLGESWTVERL
ncbi:hypothetical protein HG530_015481 [Fusarium avenaceum]|nr:hypothetical protein HG530_015481 [Fusarium avenaceum]